MGFRKRGVVRSEEVGVVIGLGQGWNQIKNNGPLPYMITLEFPHISKLSTSSNKPIAQVIRGGHRTKSIKHFSIESEQPDESYWLYTVLIPSKYIVNSNFKVLLEDCLHFPGRPTSQKYKEFTKV